MKPLRSPWFFALYRYLPHRWMNWCVQVAMQTRRPRWFVRLVIAKWIVWRGIDMSHFVAVGPDGYPNVEAFFLRELRAGARPLGEGFVSPVDGNLMAHGQLDAGTLLQAKGQWISVAQMVNGPTYAHPLETYEGGTYTTIFLTPNGYHRIHMPCDATISSIQWLPGRFFPQNEDAIHHIPRIYERNERAILCCERHDEARTPFLLVLVGASLVGGIHLAALPRQQWATLRPTDGEFSYQKGEEIAHFSFGSTVVMLFPKDWPGAVLGAQLHPERMLGESLWMGTPLLAQGSES